MGNIVGLDGKAILTMTNVTGMGANDNQFIIEDKRNSVRIPIDAYLFSLQKLAESTQAEDWKEAKIKDVFLVLGWNIGKPPEKTLDTKSGDDTVDEPTEGSDGQNTEGT